MSDCNNAELNWDDLRIFNAVVSAGTLSGASAHLKISHSQVCRRISRLESVVGVPLIRRTANRITLTTDGEQLSHFAAQMEEQHNQIQFWIKQKQLAQSGNLTINCCDIALPTLSVIVGKLNSANPDIRFDIKVSPVHEDLRLAHTDMAIRATNSPDESLVAIRLNDFTLVPAKSKHASPQPDTWIGLNSTFSHLPAERWQGALKHRCHNQIKVDCYMAAAQVIRSGAGIGLLPDFIVEDDVELQSIPSTDPLPSWTLWLVYHGSQINNALVQTFARQLKQQWSKTMEGSLNPASTRGNTATGTDS
ncbi:LysR family transcriptional regulator [Shewanella corallii]|uniref:LysR family transcriptional regulator n=1 Tax=Shewanella corallii TaxID=560080 RepID=A0ABT0N1E6_9GAMM|nr:LysR family transcriptional regulator [Shewanella corallii]MCL2912272.1 LysR family transcriptional regulator [Shewanella corallii]